jgi:hypothetical protein
MAVEDYRPLEHHPPPPGYPIYIGFAKVVALFTGDPFRALIVTSLIAVAAGLVAFAFAFHEITGSLWTAILGAALLYTSPAVLVSGTLPQSDSGALALLGVAIWACARGNPIVMAIACAATIGWRVQFMIAVVPMFLASVVLLKTWRDRVNAVMTFGIACLAWFVPLVVATEGFEGFWRWLSGQAAYYARHDADLSRSGYSASHIALRFLAHPWGPKWLSLPLLALAVAGVRRNRRLIPLAAGAIVYFAFALATMDPADAVRYAIPGLPIVAVLAATTLMRSPFEAVTIGAAAAYAAGAYLYAVPVVRVRATTPPPPTAAAKWIRANVPRNTIVLYDGPLRPQAEFLLRGYRIMLVDAGLLRYGHDPTVPMVVYADGEARSDAGVTFRWPETDSYRKLTRKFYGVVSVVPLPAAERFRIIRGVHAPERRPDGTAWRWLTDRAEIELPNIGASSVKLTFRTPPEYVLDGNRVRVRANGQEHVVTLGRTDSKELIVPAASRIEMIPERTFVPAKVLGANNRDPRTLSVMLTGVEQLGSPQSGR